MPIEDNSITGYGHLAAVRLLEDTARWGDFQQLMLCKLAHASEAAFHIDDVLEMLSGSDLWQEIVDRDMVALAGQILSGFQASLPAPTTTTVFPVRITFSERISEAVYSFLHQCRGWSGIRGCPAATKTA